MRAQQSTYADRRRRAEAAWSSLPHGGRDSVRLRIHCAKSHDVAVVYLTDAGLVFAAPVRGHSHGSYDRPDRTHDTQEPHRWFDLLTGPEVDPQDDELPAWCDCGPRTLSRATVLEWATAPERRVVID